MGQPHLGKYIMEIFPRVHLIQIPTLTVAPTQHTNSYLVGEDELAMIDFGSERQQSIELPLKYIKSLKGNPGLKTILLTHHHMDHCAGALRLAEISGADVGIHPEYLKDFAKGLKMVFPLSDGYCISVDGLRINAIYTPGHSRGHICFYLEDEKLLFTGDHIVGEGTVVIAPPEGDMEEYLNSLKKLLSYESKAICPGHGPIIKNPKEKILEYIEHRLLREKQVVNCLMEGYNTIMKLVEKIYIDVPSSLHRLAAETVKAHLIKLMKEGMVKKLQKEGMEYFFTIDRNAKKCNILAI